MISMWIMWREEHWKIWHSSLSSQCLTFCYHYLATLLQNLIYATWTILFGSLYGQSFDPKFECELYFPGPKTLKLFSNKEHMGFMWSLVINILCTNVSSTVFALYLIRLINDAVMLTISPQVTQLFYP